MTFAATDIIILICLVIIAFAAITELCIFIRNYPKTFAITLIILIGLYYFLSNR